MNKKLPSSNANDWFYYADSFLFLAKLGCQSLLHLIEIPDRDSFDPRERLLYDKQRLLISTIFNIRHGIELVMKALHVDFSGEYLKNHDLETLYGEFIKQSKKRFGPQAKIVGIIKSFKESIDKYLSSSLVFGKPIYDPKNEIMRYPEREGERFIAHARLVFSRIEMFDKKELETILIDIKKLRQLFSFIRDAILKKRYKSSIRRLY